MPALASCTSLRVGHTLGRTARSRRVSRGSTRASKRPPILVPGDGMPLAPDATGQQGPHVRVLALPSLQPGIQANMCLLRVQCDSWTEQYGRNAARCQ